MKSMVTMKLMTNMLMDDGHDDGHDKEHDGDDRLVGETDDGHGDGNNDEQVIMTVMMLS